jgi:hypothetical protein
VSHRISVEKSFAFGKVDKGQVVREQLASAAQIDLEIKIGNLLIRV